RQHADLVILTPIARQLAAAGEEDKIIGTIPLLDNVQPFVDLAAQRLAVEIVAQKDRLDGLAEFGKRLVGWVLHVIAGEPAQNRFCFRRAKTKRGRISGSQTSADACLSQRSMGPVVLVTIRETESSTQAPQVRRGSGSAIFSISFGGIVEQCGSWQLSL